MSPFSKISPKDGKRRYITGSKYFPVLTKSKKGALNILPEEFEMVTNPNGSLRLRKK